MKRQIAQTLASLFVVTAVLLSAGSAQSASRLALLIGNDAYVGDWRLNSCVNDAEAIADWLKQVGYDESEITVLTNANKADLVQSLETLRAKVAQQHPDQVFFYYSGHGTVIKDDNGDEGADDTNDEALVAIDDPSDVDNIEEILVRDDVLFDHIEAMSQNAGQVFILMDCCHSGGLTKSIPTKTIGSKPKGPAKFIHTSEFAQMKANGRTEKGIYKVAPPRTKSLGDTVPEEIKRLKPLKGVIFLSASNQYQLSHAGNPLSEFTAAFIKAVGENRERIVAASGQDNLSLKTLHGELTRVLYDIPQSPILECHGLEADEAMIPGLFSSPIAWESEQQATGIIAQMLALPESKKQQGWRLDVTPTKSGPLRVGDRFALKVKSNQKGYLVMFTVGASGKVTFLYPNRYRLINEIKAGEEKILPYKDGLQVTPPAGQEQFYVYLLERNPFGTFEFGKTAGGMAAGNLEGILRQNPALRNSINRIDPSTLGTARTRGMTVERVSNVLREESGQEKINLFNGAPPRWSAELIKIETRE